MHYPGGKGTFFQRLINLMPGHEVYIETHVGSAAVLRHKRPARISIGVDLDPQVIAARVSENLGADFVVADAVKFLSEYAFDGNELIYADPPYLRETRRSPRRLYACEYTYAQHEELLNTLLRLPCAVMISGYSSDLYFRRLHGWRTVSFEVTTRSGRRATEYVWMNYPPPTRLHDYQFLGNGFRERERIQRKTARWVARLQRLDMHERHALMVAIQQLEA